MTKPEHAYAAPSGLATTDDSNPVLGFPLLVYSARVIRPGQKSGSSRLEYLNCSLQQAAASWTRMFAQSEIERLTNVVLATN